MSFEQQSEARLRHNQAEGRERGVENSTEQADEQLEKKLGARERAEQLRRETKTTQQQQQNIMANMTSVVAAVAAIRKQLGLGQSGGSIPSVAQDERSLAAIKKKLAGLRGQLSDLQMALLAEFMAEVGREQPAWSAAEVEAEADEFADASRVIHPAPEGGFVVHLEKVGDSEFFPVAAQEFKDGVGSLRGENTQIGMA